MAEIAIKSILTGPLWWEPEFTFYFWRSVTIHRLSAPMEAEKINTLGKLCKLRELQVNLLICKMGIAVVTISEVYDN